jgi:hypothetical protein
MQKGASFNVVATKKHLDEVHNKAGLLAVEAMVRQDLAPG